MERRAAAIRAKLEHPVIDGDGHWMEPIPVFLEYLSEAGGAKSVDEFRAGWRRTDASERAIAELEYAVGELGFKAIMLRGNQERPIQSAAEKIDPQNAAWYVDTIGLDSPYDYDPLWKRCVELGVAVTQHSGSSRWPDRA